MRRKMDGRSSAKTARQASGGGADARAIGGFLIPACDVPLRSTPAPVCACEPCVLYCKNRRKDIGMQNAEFHTKY